MRIALVCSAALPTYIANSIHAYRVADGFSQAGQQVALVYPRRAAEHLPNCDPSRFYGQTCSFRRVRLPFLRRFDYGLWFFVLAALWCRWRRVDVVYALSIPAAYFSALLGLSVALEFHAPTEQQNRMVRWCLNRLLRHRRFLGAVCITEALQRHLVETHPSLQGRLLVRPDGADLLPPRQDAAPQARLRVLYCGSMWPGKGMHLIAPLIEQCPWADFIIAGGPPHQAEQWRSALNRSHVRWLGMLPPSAIGQQCLTCDVGLLPIARSVLTECGDEIGAWTSPMKLFEYFAAGTTIVASDVAVLREVLIHEENCLLCDPDAETGWIDALHRLDADRSLLKRLGERGRQEVEGRYSWHLRSADIANWLQRRISRNMLHNAT